MQIIPLCIFVIFGCSLVLAAPIDKSNQTNGDSLEVKQQKATVIANRLLQELANEQHAPKPAEQSSTNDDNQSVTKTENLPETEKTETHVSNESDESEEEEDIDYMPIINGLYEIYGDRDDEESEDDESSSELIDNEYLLPEYQQQLLRYLDEQEDSSENLPPMIHSQVMDDSIMAAEDH